MNVSANMALSLTDEHIQIIAWMNRFKNFQVILKITNCWSHHIWLMGNISLIWSQSCGIDSVFLQVIPVAAHVSSWFHVTKESFTDWNILRGCVVMELLMPLLIEMTSSLRNIVSMHDVKNLISNSLAVSWSFSDEPKHSSIKIWGRQEMLAGILLLVYQSVLVLMAKLISDDNLRVLQLTWPGVVTLLISELLCETIS